MSDYERKQIQGVLDDGPDPESGNVFRMKITGKTSETKWLTLTAAQLSMIRDILAMDETESELYPIAQYQRRPKGFESLLVRAVWTGETRRPKRGEYYLSGAIVEAYEALSDMSTPHRIARLVKPREIAIWEGM